MYKNAIKISLLLISPVVIAGGIYLFQDHGNHKENWPNFTPRPEYVAQVKEAREAYKKAGYNYHIYRQKYDTFGDYMTYSGNVNHRDVENLIKMDANGIPTVKYGDQYYHNPVTVSEFALSTYGKFITGQKEKKDLFIKTAEFLLTMGDQEGAYRYPFPYTYYITGQIMEPGWVSGMAQGQVLSVYARAYHLTGDKKFLEAGRKAFKFMVKPVEQGGTLSTLADLDPSLRNYITIEEYVVKPATYTLNGFIFAMIGLHDWSVVDRSSGAGGYFDKTVLSVKKLLDYYDVGGFTAYDLGHITHNHKPNLNVEYHQIHLFLLNTLYSITGDQYFDYMKRSWASYVD